jgi:hypothetical protein
MASIRDLTSQVVMGELVAGCALLIVLEEATVATFWRVLSPWAWIGGLIVALIMVSLIPENIP